MKKTLAVRRGFSEEAFEGLIAGQDEPEWMRARRRQAWRVWSDTPRPTRHDEPWRRTDLKLLNLEQSTSVQLAPPPAQALRQSPPSWKKAARSGTVSGGLLHVDGAPALSWLEPDLAARGVIVADMRTALREHADLVEAYFMTRIVRPGDGYFAALHGAFWRSGVFVYIPSGVQVPLPLLNGTWLSQADSALPHTLVVVETGARVALIDEFGSSGAAGDGLALNVGSVEILLGPGAQLDYVQVQNWGPNVLNFSSERAIVGRDATLNWVAGHLGSRLTKTFLDARLDESGARALLSGVYFADGEQHLDLDTEQNHVWAHTSSDLLYKGALKGSARTVWQGMIRVAPGAQRTDAYQANRNLLLSERARADSIPGLEIEADDVRCTHGSTVGQLDPEELFYLMSRGIPRPAAEQLVINGFFAPVLDRIPLKSVREQLQSIIARKAVMENVKRET
ncbi:MAG: Fe-S cluster assembly protein SufD [Thermoflexales bacterium]|nr:Fe-S cluster assembly protein SufD [Thermoflexales bacterium]